MGNTLEPMHIAIFLDQHPESLGGVQTSVLNQKKYLEAQGHRVTLVSPHGRDKTVREGFLLLPSWPITPNREYAAILNPGRADWLIDKHFELPENKVDVVHIQADFWGAILGLGFAKKHNLPTAMTVHTNVQVGTEKVLGQFFGGLFIRALSLALNIHLRILSLKTTPSAWEYVSRLAERVDLVAAPSRHFAKQLVDNHLGRPVTVIQNGVDDARINEVMDAVDGQNREPRLIWSGRMLPEKRLLEFLEAVNLARPKATVELVGSGPLEREARRFVDKHDLGHIVKFTGRVAYKEMLRILASSDALVQTSIGYETQGMTVFEAASVGTPSILCDMNIAGELPQDDYWLVADDSAEALAAAITRAVADIASGHAKRNDLKVREAFRQSTLTAETLDLYGSLIAKYSSK